MVKTMFNKIRGIVTYFNAERGFGFAERADGGGAVYIGSKMLRRSGLDSIHKGDSIAFDIRIPDDGKPFAVAIERVAGGEVQSTTTTAERVFGGPVRFGEMRQNG